MDDDDNKEEGGEGTPSPLSGGSLGLELSRDTEQEEKDEEEKGGKGKSGAPKKKFEVKKWNAVALWAWGSEPVVDSSSR